jgi:putative DNA primase/helicase
VKAEPIKEKFAEKAAPEKAPANVQDYVDDYISGKGRDSKHHEQFAANHADEIEAEFSRRYQEAGEQDLPRSEVRREKQHYRVEVSPDEAMRQFEEFLKHDMDLDVRGDIIADGQWHNIPVNGQHKGKSGGYILHVDGTINGAARNWKAGLKKDNWRPEGERVPLSQAEIREMREKADATRQRRQAETKVTHENAVRKARLILERSDPASKDHPYLTKKQLPGTGFRQINTDVEMNGVNLKGSLVVSRYIDGKLSGVQAINAAGNKLNQKGAPKMNAYSVHADPTRDGPIFIATGAAEAATIHHDTGHATYDAIDDDNLIHIARHVRDEFPERRIVIAGNNDQHHFAPGGWEKAGRPDKDAIHGDDKRWAEWREAGLLNNPGMEAAQAAAEEIDAEWTIPDFPPDIQEKFSDFSDLHVHFSVLAVQSHFAQYSEPTPEISGAEIVHGIEI